jgi:hypothetical protein
MTIFIALNGPNDDGKKPKAPAQNGWQSPGHKGINPKTYKGWFGLRMDGLICIDCDNAEANDLWVERTFPHKTWVRKTPRGYHHIYRWSDPLGEIERIKGPHSAVLPGIDVRQGPSSQIVYSAPGLDPGYRTLHGKPTNLVDFHAPWAHDFVTRRADAYADETWDEMPDGIGNTTLTAIAGVMRKQGMGPTAMVRCLSAINKITMTLDPMPKEQIVAIARSVSRYGVDPMIEEIEVGGFD